MKKQGEWPFDPTLLMVGSFVISYIITRQLRGNIAWNLIVWGQHVHHWQWAVCFLLLIFIVSRHCKNPKLGRIFDLAGGMFIGIMFDEFDMWWIDLPSPNDNTHKGLIVGLAGFSLVVLIRLFLPILKRLLRKLANFFKKQNDG